MSDTHMEGGVSISTEPTVTDAEMAEAANGVSAITINGSDGSNSRRQ